MPKKILIIDDDPIMVRYLETLFNDNGYETCMAKDGFSGFEMLKQDLYQRNMQLITELERTEKSFSLFSQELNDDLKKILRVLGVPYVNAPFEAESQCAYLELHGLVDGVVTEDSDALLFGAKKVYRNIFEKNKFVG